MKKYDKLLNFILPITTILCILIIWSVGAVIADSEYILPSVKDTAKEFFALFSNEKFYIALAFTTFRSIIAFLLSFSISSVLAFLSSKSKVAERLILPLIATIRALPTLAIILLLLFWTNNRVAPIVVTMLVVMPTSYTHVKSALDTVDKTSVEAGKVDGAGRYSIFFRIELPQIAPSIYSAVGSGLSLNFKLMVAAEVLSATIKSLGNLLNNASFNAQVAKMLGIVVVVIALGLIIEFIFNKLSQKSGSWRE